MSDLTDLTANQIKWLQSRTQLRKNKNKKPRSRNPLKWLAAKSTHLIQPGFLAGFTYAYHFSTLAWLQNIFFFLFMFIVAMYGIVVLILGGASATLIMVSNEKSGSQKDHRHYADIAQWFEWTKPSLFRRVYKIYVTCLNLGILGVIVSLGWFWWSTLYAVLWVSYKLETAINKGVIIDYVSKLSPDKIAEYEQSLGRHILEETLSTLGGHQFRTEHHIAFEDSGKSYAVVSVLMPDAPQSKILVEFHGDAVAVKEEHYGEAVEHCQIDLMLPKSLSQIEQQVVKLMGQRKFEAAIC